MSQARFQKQQRERAKREKAQAKAARKEERAAAEADERPSGETSPQDEVLEALAALHRRFEDGAVDFEAFEAEKAALLERLDVG